MPFTYPPWVYQRSNWVWIGAGIAAIFLILIFRKKLIRIAMNTDSQVPENDVRINNLVGALTVSPIKRYTTRAVSLIDTVVIHHSATLGGSAQAYARFHVNENGWPGIGYHFVIDKDGAVHQTNDLTTVSYHVKNKNGTSVGICLTGDYDQESPPQAQINSCVNLIRMLNRQTGKRLNVKGHGELQAKSCPGKNVDVRYIEKNV